MRQYFNVPLIGSSMTPESPKPTPMTRVLVARAKLAGRPEGSCCNRSLLFYKQSLG